MKRLSLAQTDLTAAVKDVQVYIVAYHPVERDGQSHLIFGMKC